MKLIIDIPEEVKHKVYAYGLSLSPSDKEQLIKAIMNGTSIPDNATNGDVIKSMFPDIEEIEDRMDEVVAKALGSYRSINKNWWNASYQKGGKE